VTTLGLGEEWKGGDMQRPGGGFKLNLLRKAIAPYKNDPEIIILFTDRFVFDGIAKKMFLIHYIF